MNLFPAFESRSAEELEEAYENVGTTEHAIEVAPLAHIPTGANARRSVADRWKNFDKKDLDAFFPAESRRSRRAEKRAQETQQRKHQRGYFRRERAKEDAARDLLNLFQLADGAYDGIGPVMRNRAQQRIADRVAYLRDQQQKAHDKALDARGDDRSLSAPTPPQRHEEIRAELWKLAQAATLPAARVKRTRPIEEFLSDPRSRHIDFLHGEAGEILGRTGRAG